MSSMLTSLLDRATSKCSSVAKRKEGIQRNIEVQIQAYAAIPKSVESNDAISYYRREIARINITLEQDINNLDAKIQALEERKRVMNERADADRGRYSDLIEAKVAKLEDPEPPTNAFRKLKAELAKCIQEEQEAEEEFQKANAAFIEDHSRQMKRRIEEQQESFRLLLQQQSAKEAEERQQIERVREQEQCVEEEKAKKRSEEAKKRSEESKKSIEPVKKFKTKPKSSILHPGTKYTIAELDAIDVSKLDDEQTDLFHSLWDEAAYREGLAGTGSDSDK